jgi:hypothetical protein
MRRFQDWIRVCLLAVGSLAAADTAGAYEYALQFTPNSGFRGLVVAGYQFIGSSVVGNCSYYTVHSGSGKGGGYRTFTTHYNQTCTWDLYGNLLNVRAGAPLVPAPLSVNGTETIYALKPGGGYTGADTTLKYRGFVFTNGSHYSWKTSNAYAVLKQTPYTFTATLVSDGDIPLTVARADVSALQGLAAVNGTNCTRQIQVGATCDVTIAYDPTRLRSATGLAYDTLTIALITNSKQAYDFVQSYTIVLNSNAVPDD